jgi:hypothetical protein
VSSEGWIEAKVRGCGRLLLLVVELTGELSGMGMAWPVAAMIGLNTEFLIMSSGVVESEGTLSVRGGVAETGLMTGLKTLVAERGLVSSMDGVGTRLGGDLSTVNTGARRGCEMPLGEDISWYIIG